MDGTGGTGRRARSGEVWAAARADYLAGFSAGEVCERRDLGLAALKKRARREGWRRADQPDYAGAGALDPDLDEDLEEELAAVGSVDLAAMTDRALRLSRRALDLGDLRAAQGWMRVWRQLRQAAREEAAGDSAAERAGLVLQTHSARRDVAEARAAMAIKAAGPAMADLARVASVHPVSPVSEPPEETAPDAPARVLNRHERRKRERLKAWKAGREARTGPGRGAQGGQPAHDCESSAATS